VVYLFKKILKLKGEKNKMPWVDENICIGCGICVEECPVNAISMENGKAIIDMEKCIRCKKCHEVCPQKAVKHDKEKNQKEVKNESSNKFNRKNLRK